MSSTIPDVLFVCVHNAGRSQMFAALLTTTPRAGSGCAPLHVEGGAVAELNLLDLAPEPLSGQHNHNHGHGHGHGHNHSH